jgi:hypothetical protein
MTSEQREMRAAQKAYFKTYSYTNLRSSKDLERRFDAILQECAEGAGPQSSLFNS